MLHSGNFYAGLFNLCAAVYGIGVLSAVDNSTTMSVVLAILVVLNLALMAANFVFAYMNEK
jgi:hypothetical protein